MNEEINQIDVCLQAQFLSEELGGQFDYNPVQPFSDDINISIFQSQYRQSCLFFFFYYAADKDMNIGRSSQIKQDIWAYLVDPHNRYSKAMKYLYEDSSIEVLSQQIGMLAFYSQVKGCKDYGNIPAGMLQDLCSPQKASLVIGMYVYFVIIANKNIKVDAFNKLFVDTWMSYFENLAARVIMFRMRGSMVDEDFKGVLVFPKDANEGWTLS